jgi:hypothetical protein
MKLKLTKAQFKALYALFQRFVVNADAKNIEAKLLRAILFSIYEKMYKRDINDKSKYTITLKDEEALAFWVFFNKYFYFPSEMVYESTLVQTVCNSIHQKFS